jgi:diketogulonate reductase-like aldo/keto reductase
MRSFVNPNLEGPMVNRREFLSIAAGTGAALTLPPHLLRALQPPAATLIQRAIPSTGEMLPVIGLGFANHASCADPAALKEVLRTFVDNGGRVFDTQHGSQASQQFHATVANELGIQNEIFLGLQGYASPTGPLADPALAKAQIESQLARFNVSSLDLVHVPVTAGPQYWAVMKEAKRQGRIRYLGTMVTSFGSFPQFEAVMRNEPLDFISVDYCIDRREADEKILPLALERKIAVLAFFPFGGANGLSCTGGQGLFARVANTPVPAWAAEFDASTWGQFFLKYVISHPAVTAARTGTTKPHHMLDNIGGGIGRLPNEAMRRRMEEFIEALPLAVNTLTLDRYAGEYKAASELTAIFRRDGDQLLVKLGTDPEVPLAARTVRRFADPQGSVFEFQLTGVGPATRATGVILEQGTRKITLERR